MSRSSSAAYTLAVAIDSHGAEEGARVWLRSQGSIRDEAKSTSGVIDVLDRKFGGFFSNIKGFTPAAAVLVGAIAAIGLGVNAAADAIDKAIEKFAEFQETMKNVKAASGATAEDIEKLSDAALKISQNSKFAPKDAAEALYALAGAGLSANEQMAALPNTLGLAAAAQGNLEQSTELVLGAMGAYHIAASESQRITDVFTASINVSSFNIERLSVAMRNAAPASASMGQTFEGTVAALSVLIKVFNNGEVAGTGLKSALGQITLKAKEMGLNVTNASGQLKPLPDVIDALQKKGITASNAIKLFGTEAGPALAILLNAGSKGLKEMEAQLKSNGQTADAVRTQSEALKVDQEKLANSIEVFWIRLGGALEGGKRTITQSLTATVQAMTAWVQDHAEQIGKFYSLFTTAAEGVLKAATAVAGWIVDLAGAWQSMVNAVKAAALAVAIAEVLAWGGAIVAAIEGCAALEVAVYALIPAFGAAEAAIGAMNVALASMSAWIAANPLAPLILVIGYVTYALLQQRDAEEALRVAQEKRDASQRESLDLLDKLKTKTEALTDAEVRQVHAKVAALQAEAAAAQEAYAREETRARGQHGFTGDEAVFKAAMQADKPLQDAKDRLDGINTEIKDILQALNDVDWKFSEIGKKGPGGGRPPGSPPYEQLDKSLQKLLLSAELAAKKAEELYEAHQRGLPAVLAVTKSFVEQDAALPGIEAKNLAAAKALAGYAARAFEAERNTELLTDADQRNTETGQKLAAARAAVADVLAGNTRASQAASRAADVETFRQKFLLAATDARVKGLRVYLEARDRELNLSTAEAAAAQREIDFNVARRTAEAALADARSQNTQASRELATQLEIESAIKSAPDGEPDKIAASIIGHHAVLDSLNDEKTGVKGLQDSYKDLDALQATFADSQRARQASLDLGGDVAAILQKYGLLSASAKELAIQEKLRAAASQGYSTQKLAELEEELRKRQRVYDAAALGVAKIEIAQSQSDKIAGTLASAFATISEAFGGASTMAGRLAASVGDLITSLSKLGTAGKAWSAEWTSAMSAAVASAGALIKSLNVGGSNKSGGPQALGGKLDGNYAGIGTLIGTILGAAIAAYFTAGSGTAGGAALGAAIGGVIGSLISKAGDSASAQLRAGGNIVVGETSRQLDGAVSDALTKIFKSLQLVFASLGLLFNGAPLIDIKVRDNIIRVIVGNVVRTFSSMQDAISFAIAEALKETASGGHLPPEVIAALKNTSATDMQSLQSDIDFAFSLANVGVPKVVQAIDKSVSDFYVAMQRAAQLGIDTGKEVQDFADKIQAQKDSILQTPGKSPADQMRADAAAFNQKMDLLRAQEEMDLADLAIKRTDLQAKIALLQLSGNLTKDQLQQIADAQAALGAIDTAIAAAQGVIAGIVKISDEELAAALARLGKGGGGGGNGGADAMDSLRKMIDEVAKSVRQSGMTDLERALDDLNDRWKTATAALHVNANAADKAEREHAAAIAAANKLEGDARAKAIKQADDRYKHETAGIAKTQQALEDANKARQQEIDLLKKGFDQRVASFVNQGPGSGVAGDLAGVDATAQGLITDARALYKEHGMTLAELRKTVAAIKAADAAQKEAIKNGVMKNVSDFLGGKGKTGLLGALADIGNTSKGLIGDLGALKDAGEITGAEFDDLSKKIADATKAQQDAAINDTANGLLSDLYGYLGMDKEAAEQKFAITIAELEARRAELAAAMMTAHYTQEAMDAILGPIDGLIQKVKDAGPSIFDQGSKSNDDRSYTDRAQADRDMVNGIDSKQVLKDLESQINEWNQLASKANPADGLKQLAQRLADLSAQARLAGASTADLQRLQASYQVAVSNFWDQALAQWEEGAASSNVHDQLQAINDQFAALLAAAQQYGGDIARIQAAQHKAAEKFWHDILQPLEDYRNGLQFSDNSPLTPAERLAAAMQHFQDVSAAALAGDAAAIQQLPAAIDQLLQEAQAMYASGAGYQQIYAMVQAVLAQVLALAGGKYAAPDPAQAIMNMPPNSDKIPEAASQHFAQQPPAAQAAPLAPPQAALYVPSGAGDSAALGREAVEAMRGLREAVDAVREAIGLASGEEVKKLDELIGATEDVTRQRGRESTLRVDMRIGNKER